MKCFSIFVAIIACIVGVFLYKFYLPLSPKLSGDCLVIPVVNNALRSVAYVGETLGFGSRVKIGRLLLEMVDGLKYSQKSEVEVVIQDTKIGGVPVRVYRPKGVDEDQNLPGLIYFHGGGFILHSPRSGIYEKLCSMISKATTSVVISVDYRLAPEHLFPAQFEDGYSVVSTVIKDPSRFGIIKDKIAIGGGSAGGHLTAAISIELSKENRTKDIAAQLLLCPWLQLIDMAFLPSYQEYSEGFALSRENVAYCASMVISGKPDLEQEYLSGNVSRHFMCTKYWKFLEIPKHSDCGKAVGNFPPGFIETVTDTRLSPLLADTVTNLPRTFVVTAEYDVVANEGALFVSRLEKAHVPVIHKTYKSYHGFYASAVSHSSLATPMATQAINDVINYLNFVFQDK